MNNKKTHGSFIEYNNFNSCKTFGLQKHGNILSLDKVNAIYIKKSSEEYKGLQYYVGECITERFNIEFNELILSWQAHAPANTWIEFYVRPYLDGIDEKWNKWYSLGLWSESNSPFPRRSFGKQIDSIGEVDIDTLILKTIGKSFQIMIRLCSLDQSITPVLFSLCASAIIRNSNNFNESNTIIKNSKYLNVPPLSQLKYLAGELLCSPTSLSMVLNYWYKKTGEEKYRKGVHQITKGVWDKATNRAGNWSFNTAYVASLGLEAKLIRLSSMSYIQKLLDLDIPCIISIAYQKGELLDAPLESTTGHLIVVNGYSGSSIIHANDPAAVFNRVQRQYNCAQLESAWLNGSGGLTYLIYPKQDYLNLIDLLFYERNI
ncbi:MULTISPECIES: C39 family peptidase [Cytobacillus]|uniref:Peptidase C39-like domain-containing protein n=1 Tax=Cytobacillus oceanisediminis TaxID=665099 RepID=A0ABX3CK68_9BACI|nr:MULTISPECIES: C39 family peptidase [Cytobacillus]OHX39637.1 hypothetical protein BBV17_29530 [Cytobacillus oceanisediminis]